MRTAIFALIALVFSAFVAAPAAEAGGLRWGRGQRRDFVHPTIVSVHNGTQYNLEVLVDGRPRVVIAPGGIVPITFGVNWDGSSCSYELQGRIGLMMDSYSVHASRSGASYTISATIDMSRKSPELRLRRK